MPTLQLQLLDDYLKTECTASQSEHPMTFGSLERRAIVAEFNGGEISSDAGLLLIRQIDQHYGFSEQIAACFSLSIRGRPNT